MKKLLISFAFALMALTANAQTYHFDVNNNGEIDLSDALIVIDYLLGRDIQPKSYLICPDENHPHAIDLGLPSGTKWACCNVGATSPESDGGYFAWGETEEKTNYTWKTYEHCDSTRETCHYLGGNIAHTIYDVAHVKWGGYWQMPTLKQMSELIDNCSSNLTTVNGVNGLQFISTNGGIIFLPFSGNKYELDYAAHGTVGSYWSSTRHENYYANQLKLSSKEITKLYWARNSGFSIRPIQSLSFHFDVNGDGSIDLSDALIVIDYILGKLNPEETKDLELSINEPISLNVGGEQIIEIVSGNSNYSVESSNPEVAIAEIVDGDKIKVVSLSAGSTTITVKDIKTGQTSSFEVTVPEPSLLSCPDDHHPHMIDLGLPSGTLWACCNVGADKPEGYGGYYAWGETSEKEVYNEVTYKYCDGVDRDGDGWYDRNVQYQSLDFNICGTKYDVAHMKWRKRWMMPTPDQASELIRYCTNELVTINGINGCQITGKNGGSIFLPASGVYYDSDLEDCNYIGEYYLGVKDLKEYEDNAYELYFSFYGDGTFHLSSAIMNGCYMGLPIRPIVMPEDLKDLELSITSPVIILVGEQQIFEIVSGNSDYTVESSNPKVATAEIVNGEKIKVSALKTGKTTITVKDIKSWQTFSFEVTILEEIKDLELSITDPVKIFVGEEQIIEILSGNSEYTLENSDPKVATVNIVNGEKIKVAALKAGETTITVKDNLSEQTVSFNVIVLKDFELSIKDSLNLLVGSEKIIEIVSGNSDYTVESSNLQVATIEIVDGEKIKIMALKDGETTITVKDNKSGKTVTYEVTVVSLCPDNHHPHMIDLGLPSGTKWACCNVGATTPTGYGGLYAWGEIEEKSSYTFENYRFYDPHSDCGVSLDYTPEHICGTEFDVAHVKWGGSWVMPFHEQFNELWVNATGERIIVNGILGERFIGSNGKSIFLPFRGGWYSLISIYWTGDTYNYPTLINAFSFWDDSFMGNNQKPGYLGCSVRPVSK